MLCGVSVSGLVLGLELEFWGDGGAAGTESRLISGCLVLEGSGDWLVSGALSPVGAVCAEGTTGTGLLGTGAAASCPVETLVGSWGLTALLGNGPEGMYARGGRYGSSVARWAGEVASELLDEALVDGFSVAEESLLIAASSALWGSMSLALSTVVAVTELAAPTSADFSAEAQLTRTPERGSAATSREPRIFFPTPVSFRQ